MLANFKGAGGGAYAGRSHARRWANRDARDDGEGGFGLASHSRGARSCASGFHERGCATSRAEETSNAVLQIVSLSLLLLAVAAVTTGIARVVRIPLPLLQIAAGALLAWPIGLHVALEPELFLLL